MGASFFFGVCVCFCLYPFAAVPGLECPPSKKEEAERRSRGTPKENHHSGSPPHENKKTSKQLIRKTHQHDCPAIRWCFFSSCFKASVLSMAIAIFFHLSLGAWRDRAIGPLGGRGAIEAMPVECGLDTHPGNSDLRGFGKPQWFNANRLFHLFVFHLLATTLSEGPKR